MPAGWLKLRDKLHYNKCERINSVEKSREGVTIATERENTE